MKLPLVVSSFFLLIGAFLLAACGTAPPADLNVTPAVEPTGVATSPVLEQAPAEPLQPTAEPLPAEYPPAQPELPVQPTYPADYPAPPTPIDPYPGGMVWIIRPVGIQCEDGTALGYGDLRESVATLTAAGLRVVEAEMLELMVTASCGSPTSAHFRVQISADDLNSAISMGWERELN